MNIETLRVEATDAGGWGGWGVVEDAPFFPRVIASFRKREEAEAHLQSLRTAERAAALDAGNVAAAVLHAQSGMGVAK